MAVMTRDVVFIGMAGLLLFKSAFHHFFYLFRMG